MGFLRDLIPASVRALVSPKERLRLALNDFELPNFPGVVQDAMSAMRDGSSLDAVGQIVTQDPKVGVALLKHVNAASFGLRHPVNSVPHAASLLGKTRLEAVLIAVGVQEALPKQKQAGFRPDDFWKAAQRRAAIAGVLAQLAHPQTRGESVTAALLQDMAVPALMFARSTYASVYKEWRASAASLVDLEMDAMGITHAEIGGWLCEMWGVPDDLTLSIREHHALPAPNAPYPAAAVVSVLGAKPKADDRDRLVQTAVDTLDLSADDVASALSEAGIR